jgi:hypothetical protein
VGTGFGVGDSLDRPPFPLEMCDDGGNDVSFTMPVAGNGNLPFLSPSAYLRASKLMEYFLIVMR